LRQDGIAFFLVFCFFFAHRQLIFLSSTIPTFSIFASLFSILFSSSIINQLQIQQHSIKKKDTSKIRKQKSQEVAPTPFIFYLKLFVGVSILK